MKPATILIALILLAAPYALSAREGEHRSLGVCKSINSGPEKAGLADLTEDELKERMCLSSLSVLRSADPMAQMQCRLAFKTLFTEFSRRHPDKEMTDVYGRC